MTQRKPPGVSFETWVESQIRRAREAGEFDDLPGQGEPIHKPGQTYDPDWWAKAWVKREKLSVLPPSIEIRREVEKTLEGLGALKHEKQVRHQIRALNAKIRKINSRVTSGPPSTQAPLDEERVVAGWRERGAESREG